jgi:hypothetical protein
MEVTMKVSRRTLLAGAVALIAGAVARTGTAADKPTITVYKSPT